MGGKEYDQWKKRQRKQIEIDVWNSSTVTENQRERPEAPAVWYKRPIHRDQKKKNHEVDQSHKKLEMVLEGKCEDDFTECYGYLKYTTYKVALSAGIHKKE